MHNRFIDIVLDLYMLPANLALKMLPEEKRAPFQGELFKHLYSASEYGLISFYPKSIGQKEIRATDQDFQDTAIVLQGAVKDEDDFTLNTVRMYKQYYRNVTVIVSTWVDTDPQTIEKLRAAGAVMILNKYPKVNPKWNLNLQLTTSLAGVKKAKELGAKYACKTRTDQRYYNPCALSILTGSYRPGRITFLGGVSNSFYARPFFVSDFLAFGDVKDLEELYSCVFNTEKEVNEYMAAKKEKDFQRFVDWVRKAEVDCRVKMPAEFEASPIKYECPETRIAYSYFLRKAEGKQYSCIQDAYEDFLTRYTFFVDADVLGFYWSKYKSRAYNPSYFHRDGKLDMAKWYAIQAMRGKDSAE